MSNTQNYVPCRRPLGQKVVMEESVGEPHAEYAINGRDSQYNCDNT